MEEYEIQEINMAPRERINGLIACGMPSVTSLVSTITTAYYTSGSDYQGGYTLAACIGGLAVGLIAIVTGGSIIGSIRRSQEKNRGSQQQ